MPAGLQAWDQSGNLIVDLGDYTVKFIGKYSMTIPQGKDIASITVNGIDGNNSFAAITGVNDKYPITDYYAKTKTNGVDLIYLPTGYAGYARTFTVEVYKFI